MRKRVDEGARERGVIKKTLATSQTRYLRDYSRITFHASYNTCRPAGALEFVNSMFYIHVAPLGLKNNA